ncbi:MAG TPA: hypothetical protein VJV79_18995 [Polyangiaceae bacterium]|nr:hypothetical protein [Polyangiaceae bacterium]
MNPRVVGWASIFCLGWTTAALADEAPAKKPAKLESSASLLAGYGAGEQFEDDTRNNYGLALGGRAGVTLAAPRLYFGLSFLHFSGYEETWQKRYTNTLDAEFGYEFRLLRERLLIRPQLALGVAQAVTIQSDNAGYPLTFHCAPGVLVGARVGPLLISVEYRRDLVPDQWPSSNSVLFGAGLML